MFKTSNTKKTTVYLNRILGFKADSIISIHLLILISLSLKENLLIKFTALAILFT